MSSRPPTTFLGTLTIALEKLNGENYLCYHKFPKLKCSRQAQNPTQSCLSTSYISQTVESQSSWIIDSRMSTFMVSRMSFFMVIWKRKSTWSNLLALLLRRSMCYIVNTLKSMILNYLCMLGLTYLIFYCHVYPKIYMYSFVYFDDIVIKHNDATKIS